MLNGEQKEEKSFKEGSDMLTADDLRLITDPDAEILHTPTALVTDVQEARKYIPAMLALLRRTRGFGLSANQVGIPEQVFVTNLPGDVPRFFINPEVTHLGIMVEQREGCLSNPDVWPRRKRHSRVIVNAVGLDEDQYIIDSARGYYKARQPLGCLFARVVQHEMEHLDGIDVLTGDVRM